MYFSQFESLRAYQIKNPGNLLISTGFRGFYFWRATFTAQIFVMFWQIS